MIKQLLKWEMGHFMSADLDKIDSPSFGLSQEHTQ